MPFDRNNPMPLTPAFHAAHPEHSGKAGALGWPLVPSRTYPGESTLACPDCGSRDVALTVLPGARGTGPGGRWRMSDGGGKDLNECNACGYRATDAGPIALTPSPVGSS